MEVPFTEAAGSMEVLSAEAGGFMEVLSAEAGGSMGVSSLGAIIAKVPTVNSHRWFDVCS
jgi:hypothetical protein